MRVVDGMLAAGIVAGALGSLPALAQERIGQAALVRNSLVRVGGGAVSAGDDVVRNETLRTGEASTARLEFVDNTNLAMAPVSTVKLDRFVFAANGGYRQAVMNLGKGAFRFVTGVSDKNAYQITTPHVAIGIRGTVLDIKVDAARTLVTLQDGVAFVCPRSVRSPAPGARGCVTLSGPTQSAIGTSKGVTLSTPTWNFASWCDRDAALCGTTTFARATGRCTEGTTISGGCVNPALATRLRQSVIVYTQPKFSYTAPLVPPRNDRDYLVPRDFHESVQFFF